MKRRLDPPTEYYDEQLKSIDESIVSSIAARQRQSHGKPGFPKVAYLEKWSEQYGVPVPILHQTFNTLFHWPELRERVEPDRYERFVPVMLAQQQENLLVTVPYLRQYNNCSVLAVHLESTHLIVGPVRITLDITGYECTSSGGGGSRGYWHQEYVVTPVIPDDQAATLDMTIHIEPRPRPGSPEAQPIPQTTIRFNQRG